MNKLYEAMIEGVFFKKGFPIFIKKIKRIFSFKRFLSALDKFIQRLAIKRLVQQTDIENDKILFMTTRGSYNCNPRAIADEIIRQGLPWKLIWVARKDDIKNPSQFPPQLKLVLRGSYEFYEEAASSKIWIDNSVSLSYMDIPKKERQVLIETWHGSIGLKRFETNSDKRWIRKATACGQRTDYCLSNSTFETNLFRNTFWNNTEILEYGHARNDILLTENKERKGKIRDHVYRELNIPDGVHIAIYAPTFRDNKKSLAPYSIDYRQLKESLENRFGGEWIILIRLHFEIKRNLKKRNIVYPNYVIDATNYSDIQDLLLVSEVGITDYSSWICDFVLTHRPAFFYATDLNEYYSERGFYYPLESTPFPLAENMDDLATAIETFDLESYRAKCSAFIADKGCIDDGHAAERAVEKIKELMKDDK